MVGKYYFVGVRPSFADRVSRIESGNGEISLASQDFLDGCVTTSEEGLRVCCYCISVLDGMARLVNEVGASIAVNKEFVAGCDVVLELEGQEPAYFSKLQRLHTSLKEETGWLTSDWDLISMLITNPLLQREVYGMVDVPTLIKSFTAEEVRLVLIQWVNLYDETTHQIEKPLSRTAFRHRV